MKRLLLMLLALAMLTVSFVSCDILNPTAEDLMEKADSALEGGRYKLSAIMDISCSNEEVDAAFDEIFGGEAMDMDIYFDGKNMSTEMSMTAGGVTVDIEMTVVDNVLYYSFGDYAKVKATVPEEEMDDLFGDMGADTSEYNPDDFAKISLEKKDGKYFITCSSYNEEKLDELLEQYEASIGATGAEDISLENVELVFVISDGKYESFTMNMDYAFTVEGEKIECSMDMGMKVDYSAGKEIVAPADADTYEEVSYGDIGL